MAPQVSRGMVTAHSKATAEANQAPKQPVFTVRKEVELTGDEKLYRFVTNASRNHIYKLVGYDDDDAETTLLLEKAVHDLRTVYIRFYDWAYVTPFPAVAALLMRRSRDMNINIWQDQESLMFRCPNCDEQFTNNPDGHRAFSEHMLDRHLDLSVPIIDLDLGPSVEEAA